MAIIFPSEGQVLDVMTDLSVARNILVRTRVRHFRLGVDGWIKFVITASRDHTDAYPDSAYSGIADKPNFELFGLSEGRYFFQALLIDTAGHSRECWYTHKVRFSVVSAAAALNASEAVMRSLFSDGQGSGRRGVLSDTPWIIQPQQHSDFAYVTVLWSNDFVDCALAWAMSLKKSGSIFRRICLVAESRMSPEYLAALQRGTCEVIPVEPIQSPTSAMKGEWSRYEFALTKLRVLQLASRGLRKIVLMDSDTLVLQNVDELFWYPAPAVTLSKASLLGETAEPRLSTGVMVLEPSAADFDGVMKLLREWEARSGEKEILRFIEQDLLDMYWFVDGRPRYYILPMSYNLYPELLDIFPWLHRPPKQSPAGGAAPGEEGPGPGPEPGVRIVHFWEWYNPMIGAKHGPQSAQHHLQMQARTKHKLMWDWYELWWGFHQHALEELAPQRYATWREQCRYMMELDNPRLAGQYLPMLGGDPNGKLTCHHPTGLVML